MEKTFEEKLQEQLQYRRLAWWNFVSIFVLGFVAALIAWPIWNNIVADLLRLPNVTYWQAWGVMMILKLIWPGGKYAVERAKSE